MDGKSGHGAQKVPLYSITGNVWFLALEAFSYDSWTDIGFSDLKNATDDALAPYLTKLPSPYNFSQSQYYTNVHLAAGYSAVAIAAATFYLDWKLGWNATKGYTAVACVLYFVVNAFLTLWIWKFEAGKVFVGVRKGGQKLTLRSSVRKYTPIYSLHVIYEAPSTKCSEDKKIQGRFTEWFNEDGYLEHGHFTRWLANNIEAIGMADPSQKGSQNSETTESSTGAPAEPSGPDANASASPRKPKKSKLRS